MRHNIQRAVPNGDYPKLISIGLILNGHGPKSINRSVIGPQYTDI